MHVSTRLIGGIGNRVFQIAAAQGYAEKHGHVACFVDAFTEGNTHGTPPERLYAMFPDVPRLPSFPQQNELCILSEARAFAYDELPGMAADVLLEGYFQHIQYFPAAFRVVLPPSGPIERDGKRVAWLHIRRGDYVGNWFHDIDLTGYYRRALQHLGRGWTVLVFSDDLPWCRLHVPLLYRDTPIEHWQFADDKQDEVAAWWLMSQCDAAITANSSFSWLGAYFLHARDGTAPVYMPREWMRSPSSECGIHPPWATVLDV